MMLTIGYSALISAGFVIVYLAIIVSCVVVVLSENRNPIRSLAWVIVLLFLPIIGLVFYLVFGRSLKGVRMISRHNNRKLLHRYIPVRVDLNDMPMTDEDRNLVKLVYALTKSPLTCNNRLKVFTHGREKFASLISDLKNAKRSIYLQYYIFNDDRLGTKISEILMRKAREGVKVKVIYDHVGSLQTSNKFFKRMQQAGVDIHPFFRVTFPQFANRINWRNHRKIVVIDNEVGYIGGMNIADRYVGKGDESGWRDTHFRVEGDIIGSLIYSFAVDWHFLKTENDDIKMEMSPNKLDNKVGLQLISGGPVNLWDNLSLCFLKIIAGARKSIYIQTPYFLPTDSLLHALEAAALSKVDVRIMIPRSSDSKMLQYASFSYITQCLKAGIKVYLYNPSMLHAKTMIVDENFVTAGSTNFDFRSFENNFECNINIYDAQINREMRDLFFKDVENCTKLTYSEWRRRPLYQRSLESVLRLFAPIL